MQDVADVVQLSVLVGLFLEEVMRYLDDAREVAGRDTIQDKGEILEK